MICDMSRTSAYRSLPARFRSCASSGSLRVNICREIAPTMRNIRAFMLTKSESASLTQELWAVALRKPRAHHRSGTIVAFAVQPYAPKLCSGTFEGAETARTQSRKHLHHRRSDVQTSPESALALLSAASFEALDALFPATSLAQKHCPGGFAHSPNESTAQAKCTRHMA